ncbi:MAG: hypothetical protein P9L91_07160 [Candidatus Zophobacter franzmannii]|nr:hypothetical protein [Candidatus Zophobacter franzmannii]
MKYFVLFLIAILVGWLYYRKTVPALITKERILLTFLRTLSVFLILVYLFNPILYYIKNVTRSSEVVFLRDISNSMELLEESKAKSKHYVPLENTLRNRYTALGYQVTEYNFATGLSGSKERTDLTLTMNELTKQNKLEEVSEIVLISDGWFHDKSFDAVRLSGKRVNPIIPSITNSSADTYISRVEFNENAYRNESTPFVVHCHSEQFNGDATVKMFYLDKLIQAKDISFKDEKVQNIEFSYAFKNTGLKKINFEVTPKNLQEIIQSNNTVVTVSNVREEKETVLIITDAMTWETMYVMDALKNNTRLQTQVLQAKNSSLYSGKKLLREDLNSINYSLLVLINSDRLRLNSRNTGIIIDNLSKGKGLLLIGMPVQGLDSVAPLVKSNISRVFTNTFSYGTKMSEYRSFDFIKSGIDNIPPVDYQYLSSKPNVEVLSSFINNESSPAIALKKSGRGQFLHLGMLNLWKWQLWDNGDGYRKFIVSICNWLSNSTEDRIAFYSDQPGYLQGERVTLTLKAFDEKMELITDLQPNLILKNSKSKEVLSEYFELSEGNYMLKLDELSPDKYTANVSDTQNNIESSLEFIVGEKGLEDANIGLKKENLQYLASLTSGTVVTASSIDGFDISQAKENHSKLNIEIPLYRKHLILILFLLVFALELLIRRRKGLI